MPNYERRHLYVKSILKKLLLKCELKLALLLFQGMLNNNGKSYDKLWALQLSVGSAINVKRL